MDNLKQIQPSFHLKIVSGFYYLFSAFFFLAALVYIFASSWMKESFPENTYLQNMKGSDIVFWGVILLVISALEAFLGFKIFKKVKTARIIAIVISAIGLLWAIAGVLFFNGYENILFIIIHSYLLWVLLKRFD